MMETDMTEATILENWDVIAVPEQGLYIRGNEDPWLIVGHDELMRKSGELARTYREVMP